MKKGGVEVVEFVAHPVCVVANLTLQQSCKSVQERYKLDEGKLEKSTYETEASGSVHLQQAESRLTSLQLM